MDDTARTTAIQQAQHGDADALQRLILEYHAPLHRFLNVQIAGHPSARLDAEDILQEAYIAAFKAVGEANFDGAPAFYGWIETIAANQLKNRIRYLNQKKRDAAREAAPPPAAPTTRADLFQQLASPQSTPSQGAARAEATAAIMSSLARLTDDQRVAITLRFLENRPVPEIAARLGKSEPAVHMLFHRGLKALREHLVSITRFLTRA